MAKKRTTMNVSVSPQLEKYVNGLVKTGDYQSASEVVREGLRLVQHRRETLERLRKDIDVGLRAIERGDMYTVDEVMGEWARRDDAAKRPIRRRKSA